MIIFTILTFGRIILSLTETISSKDSIQSRSAEIYDYKVTSAINRIFTSHDTSSTTCKTIPMVEILNNTSTPTDGQSLGRLGRRLLNDPSDDTNSEVSSTQNEIDSFLKVDDEEFNRQLVNVEVIFDGSGDTTEPTSETTSVSEKSTTSEPITTELISISSSKPTQTISFSTTSSRPRNDTLVLSGYSQFILEINCTDANSPITNILDKTNETFGYPYGVTGESYCVKSLNTYVALNFTTDSNVTILTKLYKTLADITHSMGGLLKSVNRCGDGQTVTVTDVTSCYLIDLCRLCGINPQRGICLPEKNITRCQCFVNEIDPSSPYVGEFCEPQDSVLTKPSDSGWIPIIVGILAGIAGLFCAITLVLLVIAFRRRRRHPDRKRIVKQDEAPTHQVWNLPRVRLPTTVTAENFQNYSNKTILTNNQKTNSDLDTYYTTDNTFYQEDEQYMNANLRATIRRPNIPDISVDTISTVSSYDPIDELDAIIDNEDTTTTYYDVFDDNGIFKL